MKKRVKKQPVMLHYIAAGIVVALLVVWGLTASPSSGADEEHESPSTVEHIEGSELSKVRLTQRAAERLDIQTGETWDETIDGVTHHMIPYAAVLYDAEGNAWAYTNPEPLVFIRTPLTIERIEGDRAILTEGPAAGTVVVTVGGAMLYGAEFGVGH